MAVDLCCTFSFLLKSLACCLAVALLLFIAFTCYVYYVHSRLSHIPGPPRRNFFMGNAAEIRATREGEGIIVHRIFSQWSMQYRPVFVIWFFHIPLVVVSDANLVREILVVKNLPKEPFGYKRFQYVFGQRFLGNGPLTDLNHVTWEAKRRVIQPLLGRNKLVKEDLTTMVSSCDNFLQRLETLADGATEISMTDEFFVITLESILKVAFSLTMDRKDQQQFENNFKHALEGIALSFRSPFTAYQFWSAKRNQCRDGAAYSRNILKGVLEQRVRDVQGGKDTPKDMLDHVLKMKDTIPHCDFETLVDVAITLVFGGMETMGNHMAFTLLAILLHPEVEERVRGELDEVLGERSSVTAKDVQSLPYLDKVIKESLRLHPPTPPVTRITDKPTSLGGVVLPANIPIMVNVFVLHHHPDFWQDPESFNPDRFATGQSPPCIPGAYLPFSLGPRRCPGSQFAGLEEKLLIATLLKKFSFKLSPGQTMEVAKNQGFAHGGFVRCTVEPLGSR